MKRYCLTSVTALYLVVGHSVASCVQLGLFVASSLQTGQAVLVADTTRPNYR